MAFITNSGRYVSYDCEELIIELQQAIDDEFDKGRATLLQVLIEEIDGIRLYLNYYHSIDGNTPQYMLPTKRTHKIIIMTAGALLEALYIQNNIY